MRDNDNIAHGLFSRARTRVGLQPVENHPDMITCKYMEIQRSGRVVCVLGYPPRGAGSNPTGDFVL